MKKISIICLHLGFGGIERAVTSLANSLSKDNDVTIISVYKLYDNPVFQISDNVKVKYLINNDIALRLSNYNKLLTKFNFPKLFDSIRKDYIRKGNFFKLFKDTFYGTYIKLYKRNKVLIDYIKKSDADVIITTRDMHNKLIGKYGKPKTIKIGWEHNFHDYNKKYAKSVIESVENLDYFVLVSKELKKFYSKRVKAKCVYIPNTIDEFPGEPSKLYDLNICSVGRLSEEKGFSDLIDVFDLVVKKVPQAKLNLVGDGILMQSLKNKVATKNLENNVIFHGYQKREYVNSILQNSSVYAMTSLSESFGIVLLEAFTYGLPCVAFDSASGARELIENGSNGYLIKNRNKEDMAKKIVTLLSDYDLRIKMQKKAISTAKNYDTNKVVNEWIKILK